MTFRKSVPTVDLERWYSAGWAYVMPDFDKAGHSKIEWLADSAPRAPDNNEDSNHERTASASG